MLQKGSVNNVDKERRGKQGDTVVVSILRGEKIRLVREGIWSGQ